MEALALGGNLSAAESLPDAARAFLEASREFNASGPGFVSDFERVQASIEAVQGQFVGRLSNEERTLSQLKSQTAILEEQIAAFYTQIDLIREKADAQIAALQQQIDEANARAWEILQELIEQTNTLDTITTDLDPQDWDWTFLTSAIDLGTKEQKAQVNIMSEGFPAIVNRLKAIESAIVSGTISQRRAIEDSSTAVTTLPDGRGTT